MNYNWIAEASSTTGTGNVVTLAGALAGSVPFSARLAAGTVVSYEIVDGNNREAGVGTLTNSTTLTKNTIWEKLESGVLTILPGAGLNLSGASVVKLAAAAETVLPAGERARNLNASQPYLVDAYQAATISPVATAMNSTVIFSPLYTHEPAIISGLGINVTVLGSLCAFKLGLYRLNGLTATKIAGTADIDVSTETGVIGFKSGSFLEGNIALKPGLYLVNLCGNTVANTVTVDMTSSVRHPFLPAKGKFRPSHLYSGATTGTLPTSVTFDHNSANDSPQNHPSIQGVLV